MVRLRNPLCRRFPWNNPWNKPLILLALHRLALDPPGRFAMASCQVDVSPLNHVPIWRRGFHWQKKLVHHHYSFQAWTRNECSCKKLSASRTQDQYSLTGKLQCVISDSCITHQCLWTKNPATDKTTSPKNSAAMMISRAQEHRWLRYPHRGSSNGIAPLSLGQNPVITSVSFCNYSGFSDPHFVFMGMNSIPVGNSRFCPWGHRTLGWVLTPLWPFSWAAHDWPIRKMHQWTEPCLLSHPSAPCLLPHLKKSKSQGAEKGNLDAHVWCAMQPKQDVNEIKNT